MKHNLRTKLSVVIALVVLLTVAFISFFGNLFIGEQFNKYIAKLQEQKINEIVSTLSLQYEKSTGAWDVDFIHTIGMSALYEGYIAAVYDMEGRTVWDAQAHDMDLCAQVMEDISDRMVNNVPQMDGTFTSETFYFTRNNETFGTVNIRYYSPYFFSENDFEFLTALNTVLLVIGTLSLIISVLIGILMARHLSRPILKTVDVTKRIADGNYDVRIDEETGTKEIDMLISSINHLAASLEKQENLRKQLTEDVSHELRTPIAVLQSHIELMTEGIWDPTTERLEGLCEEIQRMGKLVEELENLARIDSNSIKLNKSMIHLHEIINEVIRIFEAGIADKNLTISVDGDCSAINADGDRIRQVVVNLLSNAIKYSKDGGAISFELQETEETVGFQIKDNGQGIPENELPFIFERFYRADKSRNRKTGGSGIGLAIAKSIVEAHGGTICVESEIDRGSRFKVILPKTNNRGL